MGSIERQKFRDALNKVAFEQKEESSKSGKGVDRSALSRIRNVLRNSPRVDEFSRELAMASKAQHDRALDIHESNDTMNTFGNDELPPIPIARPDKEFKNDISSSAVLGASVLGMSSGVLQTILENSAPEVVTSTVGALANAYEQHKTTPLTDAQKAQITESIGKHLKPAEESLVRELQSQTARDVLEKKHTDMPKPTSDMWMPALLTGGALVGAKVIDTVASKGMEWWDDRQKNKKKEESFDRIISTHPKFKNVSPEEITRLKALHSMIADYGPHLLDHDEGMAGTLFTAGQYQDFDPSLLKTLSEPERNLAQSKSDKSSVFKDPAIDGLKNVKGLYTEIQGANNG